ncbi:uncharacterized protein FIBRA_05669 [Fibroporia radiculosa]|uniref:Haloacid dehalogenase, type II n=1 Tax=Fibroporia radiculosa TaxID=599839 RepID=J4GRF2_9APHY|nr:uncharacterized protein FIBRA_05669 [Fibroporia radiculosa]CCM03535.1 predicted protein [Fibroporia radiculosa]
MAVPSEFDSNALHNIQALVFDLMGTCTDWHTSVVSAMRQHPTPPPLTDADLPPLALAWRAGFFHAIFASFDAGEAAPDIDIVHAQVLDALLHARGVGHDVWGADVRESLPSPEIYLKALALLGLRPEQTAMVAAHAYDLRAAANLGMKTVYIQRPTEDPEEDLNAIRANVDVFIDGTGVEGGLLTLASLLSV